ncbi:camphor resistance protein CrcB [Salipiger aestuarii]|uniref:DUF302 domain-containing protein n=1 Tax=Salipiger aestuarii TaxID=568098 RepID=UPI0012386545|nr:DUF302 domain-containing protein [Salipiger aestuarii]KAA8607990.1 camphor resistance protein CrcB [Salipiger aestuarii]KAA8611383.1 camphor resistance protein CrcB [Salipiger aestuarii]
MFKQALVGLTLLSTAATAEVVSVPTDKSVPEAADALIDAIENAGATVFARVDHGAGAQKVGEDIGASQLVIFGNPKVGTPAMIEDRTLGLALPLHVLVYEDAEGAVHLSYEAPAARLADLSDRDLPEGVTTPMAGALSKLTSVAAQ